MADSGRRLASWFTDHKKFITLTTVLSLIIAASALAVDLFDVMGRPEDAAQAGRVSPSPVPPASPAASASPAVSTSPASPTISTTPSPQTGILEPVSGATVKNCPDVQFVGPAPAPGRQYMMSSKESTLPKYQFDPYLEDLGNGLWTKELSLGRDADGIGKPYLITVYEVDTTQVEQLGDPAKGGWWESTTAPSTARVVDTVKVKREDRPKSAFPDGSCS
ncbi:hypothetical protein [Actinoplanes subglobosus]|uniref:Uncharacterized protein n=1 Tax=Actinoplanes subglobosus TaxID=1547892 RepID=A0ABV8IKA7_9ACTN